jgi:hypothetical protein
MTPSEIKPTIFWPVAQRINQLRHGIPRFDLCFTIL